MHRINAVFQDYAWGSRSFIQNFLKLPQEGPIAEAWYSAHPKAPSLVNGFPFTELITADPVYWLGSPQGDFPFLLKILAADEALSIQVHPSKQQAEEGFRAENLKGVPQNSPIRNYKDSNHKPEMMLALTDFSALCGIRRFPGIVAAFQDLGLSRFFRSFTEFQHKQDSASFCTLYQEVLHKEKLPGLHEHLHTLPESEPWKDEIQWIKKLIEQYPEDRSVVSPLLLNLIHLKPMEALFLDAGIVHAYLHGAGIEIMSQSDNVLRAGLSPKHIDVPELLKIMQKQPYSPLLYPAAPGINMWHYYPVPVPDFLLSRIQLDGNTTLPQIPGPKILMCIEGSVFAQGATGEMHLHQADSAIIPAAEPNAILSGRGHIVLASCGNLPS